MTTKSFQPIQDSSELPVFDIVPVYDSESRQVKGFNGVRRLDTNEIVAVNTDRYELVQHRKVAEIVDQVAKAFGVTPQTIPAEYEGNRHFQSMSQTLYDRGRSYEYKLVIPKRYPLGEREAVYPGIRVTNSVNGKYAVSVSGFGLRLACTNQLYAQGGDVVEVRQLHVAEELDILGIIQGGIDKFLGSFDKAMDTYADAMNQWIPLASVQPRLVKVDFPEKHAKAIAALAGAGPDVTRWSAYQAATDYLTHQIGAIAPPRERFLERRAARALLLPEQEGEFKVVEAVA